jgi:3-phytase
MTTKASLQALATGLVAAALSGCATTAEPPRPVYPALDIPALAETAPVGTANDDAADDPAIWRNAANPAASLILGTDKKAGLYVYGLDGKVRDFVAAGALNNVDLREVTTASGKALLVAASDRTDRAVPRIAMFWLDGAAAKLTALPAATFMPAGSAPAEAYGFCMGAPLAAGELARAYVVMKDGTVAESAIVERGGKPVPTFVRSAKLATQPEGCVVDDEARTLYVGEEDVAIWRLPLAEGRFMPEAFARVGEADGLVDDIEGLAIAGRWLIASSQGDNAYAVFDKATGALAGRFRIQGGAIDGTYDTDGIEAVPGDFGPGFPEGLFVAQDGDNAPDAQNFKLLSWKQIREALDLK